MKGHGSYPDSSFGGAQRPMLLSAMVKEDNALVRRSYQPRPDADGNVQAARHAPSVPYAVSLQVTCQRASTTNTMAGSPSPAMRDFQARPTRPRVFAPNATV